MKPLHFLATLAAALVAANGLTQSANRIRIVPQTSDERIEDILESADGTRLITHDRGFAPRLWDGKTLRLLRLLSVKKGTVDYIAFSHDGKLILTVARDGAQIYDAQKAKLIHAVDAPEGVVLRRGAMSKDGARIALGGIDGTLLIWTPLANKTIKTKGHKAYVNHLVFSEDGKRVVSSAGDNATRLWDAATGQLALELPHPMPVQWSQISPDGKTLLTTCLDNLARAFDVATGKELYNKPHVIGSKGMAPQTLMSALFVGSKGEEVLYADNDGTMHIVEARTGKPLRQLKGHKLPLREIRKSSDGMKVATYGDDEQLLVWDIATTKTYPFTRVKIGEGYGETAGEFSSDNSAFLLGYTDGSIRRHVLADGSVTSETLGALSPLQQGTPLSNGNLLWLRHGGTHTLIDVSAPNEAKRIPHPAYSTSTSPDGTRLLIRFPTTYNVSAGLYDTRTAKYLMGYMALIGASFSSQSDKFVTWHEDGGVTIWNAADGEKIKSWMWKGTTFEDIAFSPDGTLLVSSGHKDGAVIVWNWETGKTLAVLDGKLGDDCAVAFSPDGKFVLASGEQRAKAFEVATGKVVFENDDAELSFLPPEIMFSPDGKRAFLGGVSKFAVIDTVGWKVLWSRKAGGSWRFEHSIAKDWKTMVTSQGAEVQVLDMQDGKVIASVGMDAHVGDVGYAQNDTRILSIDATDGVTIWDAKPIKGGLKKLGSLVVMKNGNWLVMDPDGRFDAPDPSKVEGASFVLEWDGGLESISVPQLKDLFYEPGLLAKLLGVDKDPVRPVPDLTSLHLYPEISLKKKSATAVDIAVKPRDQGGFGTVSIFINGKMVQSKKSTGFSQFDAAAFSQYLLPETHLPKGRGNVIQVIATNDRKDLSSPMYTIDIGVPPGLKTPEVKLHVLCVGVSDYVGTGGDLFAPSSDARALSKAIVATAERLLPGKVTVTTLTTDGATASDKPSRENILAWFKQTADRATSADIVLAFFAGHGVSRIGEQRGYFFLTPEADPTAVGNAVAGTASIAAEDLRQMLGKIAANKQVVILDTCHSGAASESLLGGDRSTSGDYQRAWESIRDATGTWLLAGSAADQLSYESANVEHGMLTYSLLEAIDRASADGLRQAPSGEFFVDVERWLTYAASRVESLKNEVGLKGIQRPEFKRSASGTTFDIGVTTTEKRGTIGLKPPKPVVIIGEFEMDKEDPAGLEESVRVAMRESTAVKPWFDIPKHPGVFRIAGSYTTDGAKVTLKVYLQKFDAAQARKTIETFELTGAAGELAAMVRKAVEERVVKLAADAKPAAQPPK